MGKAIRLPEDKFPQDGLLFTPSEGKPWFFDLATTTLPTASVTAIVADTTAIARSEREVIARSDDLMMVYVWENRMGKKKTALAICNQRQSMSRP